MICPRYRRLLAGLILTGGLPAGSGGCASSQELNEARRQVAECRMELAALKERAEKEQTSCGLLKAQRDRLEAELADARDELGKLREPSRGGDAAARAAEVVRARAELERQQKELEAALAAVRRSREEWEQALADRQKQIEMLSNQVDRLQRELAARPK